LKLKVLFRVDGSHEKGLGHLVRCSALAQMIKNDFDITFFCKEIPEDILEGLKNNGFSCDKIDVENKFHNQLNYKTIVVMDGYHFDAVYQKQIKAKSI